MNLIEALLSRVGKIRNWIMSFSQKPTPIDRLSYLKSKDTLTNEEMNELVSLSPPKSFKRMPNLLTLGVKDVAVFFENSIEGTKIAKAAFEEGFFIEVISLRLQAIELYLRMYVVAMSKNQQSIDPDTDKRTFGNYINDCANLGFDATIIAESKDFNQHRINAIHKFLVGSIKYSDLKAVCEDTIGLSKKVVDYVGAEIGVPIV